MYQKPMIYVSNNKLFPQLPLSLNVIGLSHNQDHIDRPQGFPCYQWIQSLHGRGRLHFGGQEYTVDEGQGFLLPPHLPHIYYTITPKWFVNFLCFSGNNVEEIMKFLNLCVPNIYALSAPEVILDYEQQIYDTCLETDFHYPINVSKLLYSLLLELSQDIFSVNSGQKGVFNAKIHEAIQYMSQRYMQPISLQDIASCIGLSREYFCQLFKTATCCTPGNYLLNIRMAAARTALLQHSELTVKEIAIACGFESASYFCSIFRREEGISPGQYRLIH